VTEIRCDAENNLHWRSSGYTWKTLIKNTNSRDWKDFR